MGAVKNKPGLQDPNQLFARYSSVPMVYVESEDDYYIFYQWFKDKLSHLEFLPVNHRSGSLASGCKAVIKAVHTEAVSGNPAWGIVDRDAVMSEDRWDLVHETDDSRFDVSLPFGQRVKVLRRWEMESYLVDADILEQYRSELAMQSPRSSAEILGELLADCQALIPHAALNAMHHVYKESGLGDGRTNSFKDRQEVEACLVGSILTSLARHHPECRDIYAQHLSQVEVFDTTEAPLEPRVQSLLRRVHGKAVFSRFKNRHKIKHDFRGPLATLIKTAGRVPEELSDFVQMVIKG